MTESLHIATFNAENFYLLIDGTLDRDGLESLSESDYQAMNGSPFNPNKERGKLAAVASIILRHDFDLVGLCEIGGMETLENFNRLYLEDGYDCYLHEENSTRGIFVGALAKKGRFPGMRAKNVKGAFSRNLLMLDLGRKGAGLRVFIVHLKAQYGEDHGLEQRTAEVQRLCEIVRHRKCLVMGDFNGILIRGHHQFEYESFLELPFYDVLAAVGIPPEKRRTHYYFGNGSNFSQLDYIFCTHDIHVEDASVLEDGIPQNRQERSRLPSDHLFLRAKIFPES